MYFNIFGEVTYMRFFSKIKQNLISAMKAKKNLLNFKTKTPGFR